MQEEILKKNIQSAVELVYRVDSYLIEKEAHEQTISSRFALHLQHLFPEWNVDVEYNRQGESTDSKTDETGHKRRPDVVIHKRGPAGPNLAIFLIKCEWNTQDRQADERVLSGLKSKHRYEYAFLGEIKRNGFEIVQR